jgi:CDP-diacylglycerol--serine O-phosphatidyltransferase
MKNTKKVIPNLFTTLNIFCGFLALISILEDKIVSACWLISLAAVFDVLDGQFARLTKTSSSFGIEFDSLADIVSFGVVPSILFYKTYLNNVGKLGIIISFLPLIFGGIRLARFNVLYGNKAKTKFVGLPIPYSALHTASFIIFNYHFWDDIYLSDILIPQLLFICILMVSTVEYYTLPKISFKHSRTNSIAIIVIILTLLILALRPFETFYPLTSVYILWGVVRFIHRQIKGSAVSIKST